MSDLETTDGIAPSPRYAGERDGERGPSETLDAEDPSPRPSPPSTGAREQDARPSAWLPLALVLSLLSWASAFAAIRVGLRGYSPQSLALLRFLVASVGVGALAAFLPIRRPKRTDLPLLLIAAVMGIPVYHVSL